MKMTLKTFRFQPLLSKKIDFAIIERPQEADKTFVTKFFNSSLSVNNWLLGITTGCEPPKTPTIFLISLRTIIILK